MQTATSLPSASVRFCDTSNPLPPPQPCRIVEDLEDDDLELREQAVEEADPIERCTTECEEGAVQHMQGPSLTIALAVLALVDTRQTELLFGWTLSKDTTDPSSSPITLHQPVAFAIVFVAAHLCVDKQTISRLGCVLLLCDGGSRCISAMLCPAWILVARSTLLDKSLASQSATAALHALFGVWLGSLHAAHVSPRLQFQLATACLLIALRLCNGLVFAARTDEWRRSAAFWGFCAILPFGICCTMARMTVRLRRARDWASRQQHGSFESERLLCEAHESRPQPSHIATQADPSLPSPLENSPPAVGAPNDLASEAAPNDLASEAAGTQSSGMCTLSMISSDDIATPYISLQPLPALNNIPLFGPSRSAAATQPPPRHEDEAARQHRIEAWKESVHCASFKMAKHEVPTQEYAGMRKAAQDASNLLSRLPRELHKAIGWHVVHARAAEDRAHRIQRVGWVTRFGGLLPNAKHHQIMPGLTP